MILFDNDKNLAAVPRYEWEQLAEKGRKELQKLRILESAGNLQQEKGKGGSKLLCLLSCKI